MAKKPRLTGRQKAFIAEYMRTLNGYRSAKFAGYKGNDATLRSIASENLTKPNIRAEIDRRMEEAGITDNEILFRLQEQAMGDFSDAMTGDRLDVEKLIDSGKGHLIKEYRYIDGEKSTSVSIKFHDSQAALVHLAKLKGMYKDDKPQWKIDIINLVVTGKATVKDVEEEFGSDLVDELFKSNVSTSS